MSWTFKENRLKRKPIYFISLIQGLVAPTLQDTGSPPESLAKNKEFSSFAVRNENSSLLKNTLQQNFWILMRKNNKIITFDISGQQICLKPKSTGFKWVWK